MDAGLLETEPNTQDFTLSAHPSNNFLGWPPETSQPKDTIQNTSLSFLSIHTTPSHFNGVPASSSEAFSCKYEKLKSLNSPME
jgi:hypothetical protein